MKYIIGLLVFILLYFIFTLQRIKQFSKNANLAATAQPSSIMGQGKQINYVAAGDSTAVGIGASSTETSYTYQIFENLAKTNHVAYTNVAISGAETQDVIDKQLTKIINLNPQIVTISIGANDLTHLVSSAQILGNYKFIITNLTQKTDAKIYITSIPAVQNAKLLPWWYRHLINSKAQRLNPQIAALASDRVSIVNIHDFGWDKYPDIQATFAADNFHPSDLGYQNWRNAFLDKIAKKD
ncbi:MAG: hypothetical protein NVSMB66_1550 [Candidatus Doudnabacteria bacterium]